MRVSRGDAVRATRTPSGPAALELVVRDDRLDARAWGPGAEDSLDGLEALIGEGDEVPDLVTRDPVMRELVKACRGMRIGRTSAVMEALVPAVLEQKITGAEARRIHRALVLAHGEKAPGPHGLYVPPSPDVLAGMPYWKFHRVGLERRRAETIVLAARHATKIESTASAPTSDAYRILRALPGIGVWTAAEVGARAYGDPDAVSLGDFHLPHLVSWTLAGERRGSDQRMLELLAPFEGQRGRVVRMIEAKAARRPRIVPRPEARSIAGI
jgi:3-methyladenine DNA glycosylase/8-oxoguanine DNA glycosylase